MRQRGSVLVMLLWCMALLSVAVIGLLHSATIDLKVVKNSGDSIQAYYLALAGAEKAKAVIFHDAASRKRSAQNHTGAIYNSPEQFRDIALGRGQFRVVRQFSRDEGGGLAYGVSDEASRLSVNEASAEELLKLPGMTPEVAAAIVDWRDEDHNTSQGGAEADYYLGLRPGYLPRDGRIQTARELLQVRGVDPALLRGEDANFNGLLDAVEADGDLAFPPDNHDQFLDAGWTEFLSFESRVRNLNAAGEDRVDVQQADEATLTKIPGLTQPIAKAIVAFREQNKFESVADLLEVAALSPAPQQRQPQTGAGAGAAATARAQPATGQPVGPKLVSQELFLDIADDVTVSPEGAHRGLVNINSASMSVLLCLPGISNELANAIVLYRASAGFFPSVAHLLNVPGMTREVFKQVAPRITARSETFRIISEGKVASSGAQRRIEMIVQLSSGSIQTVSYRENL